MTAMRPDRIVVVGAGPAGQATALALARAGFDIDLIDAGSGPAPAPEQPDLRVFALSPASIDLLTSLSAWPVPLSSRVCAYRYMHVWQRDPDAGFRIDAAAQGWSRLGCIIEHGVLQHALATALSATPAVRCHWGVRAESLSHDEHGTELQLDDGRCLPAALVVAADGAGSPMRKLASLSVDREDYRQAGLVANIYCTEPHTATARQRFLPGGPLAFLPLASGVSDCSIVWSLDRDEAQRLHDLPEGQFEQELAQAMGGAVGRTRLLGARALFPLARQLAGCYHRDRVVLVADAAHVVHPLAGQGLNLGFLDVAALADVLGKARRRGLDIGTAAVLGRYARRRQSDNILAARAFEAISCGYRFGGALTDDVRDLGMRLLDRSPALKRRLILQASGLAESTR